MELLMKLHECLTDLFTDLCSYVAIRVYHGCDYVRNMQYLKIATSKPDVYTKIQPELISNLMNYFGSVKLDDSGLLFTDSKRTLKTNLTSHIYRSVATLNVACMHVFAPNSTKDILCEAGYLLKCNTSVVLISPYLDEFPEYSCLHNGELIKQPMNSMDYRRLCRAINTSLPCVFVNLSDRSYAEEFDITQPSKTLIKEFKPTKPILTAEEFRSLSAVSVANRDALVEPLLEKYNNRTIHPTFFLPKHLPCTVYYNYNSYVNGSTVSDAPYSKYHNKVSILDPQGIYAVNIAIASGVFNVLITGENTQFIKPPYSLYSIPLVHIIAKSSDEAKRYEIIFNGQEVSNQFNSANGNYGIGLHIFNSYYDKARLKYLDEEAKNLGYLGVKSGMGSYSAVEYFKSHFDKRYAEEHFQHIIHGELIKRSSRKVNLAVVSEYLCLTSYKLFDAVLLSELPTHNLKELITYWGLDLYSNDKYNDALQTLFGVSSIDHVPNVSRPETRTILIKLKELRSHLGDYDGDDLIELLQNIIH